ncbi:MAG TPA: alpha/beta fold hydrolase [Saprospiraceae bacterium]|nr:alpha/beta fold hydrolase [Saprospiraceae bacterium]
MEWLLFIIILIYVSLCLIVYFFQHYFFFRPEILSSSFEYKYPFPFEELNFDMPDGGRINAVYFKVPNSRGVIYYLKGNSRSIKGWGKFARDFVSNGYDLIMMDYRGFGKSRGKRNITTLFDDAQLVYKWIKQRYSEDQIVIFGRSLGTGIATRIASWNYPRLLILDSPFYSFEMNIRRYIFFLPVKWLLRYNMRTDHYIKEVKCPVEIIHGDRDVLIPYRHSVMLLQSGNDRIRLHTITGGGHNNLPSFPEYYEILYDLLYIPPEIASNNPQTGSHVK